MASSLESRLMVIAHRGSTTPSIKENTIDAFQRSLEEGADMIETDIRSTKDKMLVCSHNPDWKGKKIKNMTYVEWKTKAMAREGWHPPLLSEVFSMLKNGIKLNIEIKERGLEKQILAEIPPSFSKQNVIISSFEESVIEKVKAVDADVRTALIVGQSLFIGRRKAFSYWRDYFPEHRLKKAKADIICPHFRLANKTFVQRLQRKGYGVYVWTVNHPERIKKVAKSGADGIFTDNIKAALEQRK